MCILSRSRILDRHRSRSRKHQEESGLCNLRTKSAESIALPATSVPHRDGNLHNHVLDDAKALRDIFSAPSSVRGYETARTIQRRDPTSKRFSSDTDLARQTPTRSANSKLGALGHAVKQRLSESRLSKESLKTTLKKNPSLDSPQRRGMVSTSCRSTGLTDLLLSRTASEGGYDSDAKDISALRLRASSTSESLRISPEYYSEALSPQHNPWPKKTSSTLSIQEYKPDLVAMTSEREDVHEEVAPHEIAPARADVQEVVVPETEKANGNATAHQDEGQTVVPLAPHLPSEDQSIHLGDMRISQRLASTSVMPMTSLSSTNFGSGTGHDDGADLSMDVVRPSGSELYQNSMENDLPWHLQRQPSTAGRYPSFVAQEHNRKPSDPRTRRLFEDAIDGSKLHLKWKSITSANSMQTSVREGHLTKDDASSHYMAEGELPGSGAASLTDITQSETIKNANSLAVPGRRASAGMGQRYGSLRQSPSAEEGAWFGDSKHKKHHSLEGFEDGMAAHDKGDEAASMSGERGSVSRESRFTEEAMDLRPSRLGRFLSSVEANEGMSEITDRVLQEKRHEIMSEVAPDAKVLGARSRGGTHEKRSTSEGWLTQGRRSGFGYDFVDKTTSRDLRFSRDKDIDKGPRNEPATLIWGRTFKDAREEVPIGSSSKSLLSVPFWSNLAGRKTSRSSFNEEQERDFRRPRSVASERKATPCDLPNGHLDLLGSHQLFAEVRKPLPRLSAHWSVNTGKDESSQPISTKESSRKKSLFDIRRYGIACVNDESTASPAAFRDQFPSWTKFPSHTRKERCGAAAEKDGVGVRHFSPTSPDMKRSEFQSNLTIHKNRSASSHGTNGFGSWRKLALGHMRRKSKSMTFSRGSASPKHKIAHRSFFWQLKDFYRSQSSDLRRLQNGHRSSVTMSHESKYPELDIPAGFGPFMPFAIPPTPPSRRSLDQRRILESMSEDKVVPTEHGDEHFWRTGTRISTGYETENCFLAGEARRWSPQKSMQKTSTSKGFDGTVSSKISEEDIGDMTESDCDLNSAQQHLGNGTYGSFVSVTASNGFGNDSGDFGVQTREFRLASTELRDSTIDFRTALMEREQRSRDDLLRLTKGLDGTGEGDGNGKLEEKKEDRVDSKA